MTKLTLSADKSLVRKAKKYAASQNSSLSTLVDRLLRATVEGGERVAAIGPLTASATGIIPSGRRKPDRRVLEDALLEKHGL